VVLSQKALLDEVLLCDDLYCANDKFFTLLQDKGEVIEPGTICKNGYWKSKKYPIRQYKFLKQAAGEEFIDMLKKKPEYFGKIPAGSTYQLLNTVCNWFLKHRLSRMKACKEISAWTSPVHWPHVKDEKDCDKIFYLVQQQREFLQYS
jgi:hypothetical protein